jgi:long-subunit acyl-CoA synthetase (AMP-forming)
MIGIHRARYLVTGAAPISPELVKWYLALGVPMLEVWGMTETCGASTGVPAARIKPGSIGRRPTSTRCGWTRPRAKSRCAAPTYSPAT